MRGAYGQVPKRKRSNLVTRLAGEAAQNMTTADGQVDTGLAAAIGTLTALFARLDTQERPESQPHDPVPAVAGVLAVLDRAREEILASLSDEQRERVPQVDTESDPAAQTWVAATLAAVSKVADPAVNGRSRASGGNRTSARETAKRIQVAVAEAEAPLTLSELADKAGVSAATLWSRWKADNTPGVVPFEDGKGRKAFKAA